MDQEPAQRRGYLQEEYRLFHLRDDAMQPVRWHYHSFHKILVLLAGQASYAIEGQSYPLEPGDLVLVPRGCMHRPVLTGSAPYERFVLYLAPSFLRRCSSQDCDLTTCFQLACSRDHYVLRPDREDTRLPELLLKLRRALIRPGFGQDVLCQALLLQFLVAVTRYLQEHQLRCVNSSACDEKIVALLKYLNLHLTERHSIDSLSRQFYISKYYMMRRFKAETGYTIHQYLTEKRLLLARERIAGGACLSQVSALCGFGDYSAFARAYKKRFGGSPNTPIHPRPEENSPVPLD